MNLVNQLLELVRNGLESLVHYYHMIGHFFEEVLGDFFPRVRLIFIILLYAAMVGILLSHIIGVWKARTEWKPLVDTKLMYSYFCGTGTVQRKKAYKYAHILVNDYKWLLSGICHRLGNYKHESKGLLFVITLIYIPMALLGGIEYLLRVVIGTIYLIIARLMHILILLVLQLFSYLFIIVAKIVDKVLRRRQHCTACYKNFSLPKFKCSRCRVIHTKLLPGRGGVLFIRCECGKFLASSIITGRSKLEALCPICDYNLAASNAKQFSVQLIGGDSSGKTAFLAAFHHQYAKKKYRIDNISIYGKPEDRFRELSKMFMNGVTKPSSQTEVFDYNFVHKKKSDEKYNLIIYDVPDEVIVSGVYEKNPVTYMYSKGVIIIIDPLSVESVRKRIGEGQLRGSYSKEDVGDLIIQFINQYSKVVGRSSNKVLSIPIAVLISKVDIKEIKQEVGMVKIKSIFASDEGKYGDLEVARDVVCREYLSKIGLTNVLNNLESVFSNVCYFPVSAIGRDGNIGYAFEPFGVLEPLRWIAKREKMDIYKFFGKIEKK